MKIASDPKTDYDWKTDFPFYALTYGHALVDFCSAAQRYLKKIYSYSCHIAIKRLTIFFLNIVVSQKNPQALVCTYIHILYSSYYELKCIWEKKYMNDKPSHRHNGVSFLQIQPKRIYMYILIITVNCQIVCPLRQMQNEI